ncbi:protein-export chaperone SecB [Wenzhouxiangella sp. XN79A]|uniref:protein-export chaperone SecB n=1 Tax=Wenzhouxiangella sp. XN79A TaxID=2724193 RepID=UPI00144A8C90|nr:protein-export chaperone SecB [Wenzhouxiangella sp. XN79A]NKI35536.1 protein-export chaperone SecB [Wenzhouxiangella sp. XN79A]
MAEQPSDAATGAENQQQASMTVQHVFLKDASFEAPGALGLDGAEGQPDMNLNLSQRVNTLEDGRYEVILTVTVTAKQGDRTAFIAEVHYAGIFQLVGFSEQQLPYVINVLCPNLLFPYARTQVGQMIAAGGFVAPPLQPINFEQIYAQRMQQAQQGQGQAPNGAAE